MLGQPVRIGLGGSPMIRRFRGRQNITIVEFFHHDLLSDTCLHDARQQWGCRLKFERVGSERQQGFAATFQIEDRFTIEQDEAGTRPTPRTTPPADPAAAPFFLQSSLFSILIIAVTIR